MVDGQHVDRLAAPCRLPAGAAVGRVPASDCLRAADEGEILDVALDLPVVLPHDTIDTVRARHLRQRAAGVIVSLVVRDCARLVLRVFQVGCRKGSILGLDIPVVADAAARSVEMLKILEKNMLMDGSRSGMTRVKWVEKNC